MDFHIVLIALAVGLIPMLAASVGWLLARRVAQRARRAVALFSGVLPNLVPAGDVVRQEYTPGDTDVLWALGFVAIVALIASSLSLALLELFNVGRAR